VDLTGDDVQDILQLLDSLPFGEMHLRTARFSLWLRRDADGEWTQELQILSEPVVAVAAARSGEVAAVDAPAAGEKGTAAETPAGGERGTAVDAPAAGEKGTAADTDGERGTAGAAGGAAPAVPPPSGAEPDGLLRAVRAPLPGTFYRAPMPGAPPFVEVGSRVEPDTVVGIVETMKLMNSVSAGARGTVEQIPLANAQFAERDAVLMWIREDA
jgi:acetyl-CoA carboxylase biotin carboxyl carrier protein